MKCRVCGKRMIFRPEDKYVVTEAKSLMTALTEAAKTYEAFDCKRNIYEESVSGGKE